jgi:excisionase family DNA binding protein
MDDKPLTTGEVAEYCHVSPVAVWKWIKKGKLKAYRLPGGHYRVEKQALKAFLIEHDIPVDPAFFARPEKRILVVDDEPSVVEIASRALQQLGDDVTLASAADGFEAGLQVATFRPHLLILDLMMPQIDGFEVCRMIRENPATAHIKILIITAYGNHHNIQQALSAGANDFMHKPLDIQQLKEKAATMLAD